MKPVKLSRTQHVLASMFLLFSICITCGDIPPAAAQDSIPEEVEQVASFEDEHAIAVRRAAELAAVRRIDGANVDPTQPGYNANNVSNASGTGWHPTENPKERIVAGEMRSDTEEIPGGFTKDEADRAEIQEAEELKARQSKGFRSAPTNCRTYWPSPYQVCGAIRVKYDALGGPGSFLTWPKSHELATGDQVGRRTEFINGFIYWHPRTGAHSVSTHFSTVWARNGWETGRLGYPTSDELGLPDNIGRKQTFERGHIYGSLAGLASVEGEILKRWLETGGPQGPLGYPTTDELGTPDGQGRFNRFLGGMVYWHPRHGARDIRGEILARWQKQGYEQGPLGYPIATAEGDNAYRLAQQFEHGNLYGYIGIIPRLTSLFNYSDQEVDYIYDQLKTDYENHGIDAKAGFQDSYDHAQRSLDAVSAELNQTTSRARFSNCDETQLIKPGNARTNPGDLFFSAAVSYHVVPHGHVGIFVEKNDPSDPRYQKTVEAISPKRGVELVDGMTRRGVCKPRYLSVNTDNTTRERAVAFAKSKEGKGYNNYFMITAIGPADQESYNCSQLVWAAYKYASYGLIDIGQLFPGDYRPAVYPYDILLSWRTREFQ